VRRRVYVHGIGACTPLGNWARTSHALAEGATAIRPIDTFDATGFPCPTAAAMPSAVDDPEANLEDRRLLYARRAAREALEHTGALRAAPERIGVFIGAESGRGRWQTVLGLARAARASSGTFDHERFGHEARAYASRIDASVISPAAVAEALAKDYNAHGPVETISLACASGGAAIVEAIRAIRLGEIDVALCGGVGADVDPLMVAGFGLLGILSPRGVSCPFDVERDGFIVGEGAAMLVLSAERPAAPAGDVAIEIAGIARSLDAYRITAPEPDGDGAARAMTAALRDADETAVDYVQAHGTSTPLNDRIEAAAIRRVLGAHVDRAHVSSAKGALGHWVAGAGAVGALYAHEAVARDRILPTAGLRTPDADCNVNHVIGAALRKDCRVALANSFAFGGANACLVLRRAA
jgi:3-oxoacyl-[acyl-carrier-protein] synthase II